MLMLDQITEALNPYPIKLKTTLLYGQFGNRKYCIINFVDKRGNRLNYTNDILISYILEYKAGFKYINIESQEQTEEIIKLYEYFENIGMKTIKESDNLYVELYTPQEIQDIILDIRGVLSYGYTKHIRLKKIDHVCN
jgi:hypothetical protein